MVLNQDNVTYYAHVGFLLRFVKGGNKFAIAVGRHLVNVSK